MMTRFAARALALVLTSQAVVVVVATATGTGTAAGTTDRRTSFLKIPPSLQEVASIETSRNPQLQSKDTSLRRELNRKLLSSTSSSRRLDQQEDASGNTYSNHSYQWDSTMDETQLGFDITNYAVKYTQCSTIQSYSDELAEDQGSSTVLEAKRFALFRMCPADTCSDSSSLGCSSNYGEYIVSLDQFLVSMLEYKQSHVVGYCQYCQDCATIESVKIFYKAVPAAKASALAIAQADYELWFNKYGEAAEGGEQEAPKNYYYYLEQNSANSNSNYNSNNYANNYASNYYYGANSGSSSSSSSGSSSGYNANQYSWENQKMWEFGTYSQNAWQSMASGTYGTYFGKKVLNGYFDENGDFVQSWGYFDSTGNYVSIEGDEEFVWDSDLFGTQPEEWADYTADSESCNYQYSGSCYSQYSACMTILQDEASKNSGYSYSQVQGAETLLDFLECTEVIPSQSSQTYSSAYGNGNNRNLESESQRYFIGPHCSSNGHDINLAVYSDPYCAIVNGNMKVTDLIAYDPLSETDLIPSGCLGCSSDQYDSWYEGDDVDGIQPFCSMLYQLSGKCNTNLEAKMYSEYAASKASYSAAQEEQVEEADEEGEEQETETVDYAWKQIYQSSQQQSNEQAVCSFITALTSNTYNEHGQVTLYTNANWANAWANPAAWSKEFNAERKELSVGMKIALSFMGLSVIIMSIVVCILHGQLARKNIPVRPRRMKGEDPTDLARQNSGITMGRSRSGPASTPLI